MDGSKWTSDEYLEHSSRKLVSQYEVILDFTKDFSLDMEELASSKCNGVGMSYLIDVRCKLWYQLQDGIGLDSKISLAWIRLEFSLHPAPTEC